MRRACDSTAIKAFASWGGAPRFSADANFADQRGSHSSEPRQAQQFVHRLFSRTYANAGHSSSSIVQRELHYAATHRSEFMWPWEEEPRSIAHGILDDETYDWFAVIKGMLTSGGGPVVVDERLLVEACALARETTGINVDHTGAAGLAGLLELSREGAVAPRENVAVIFSGGQRGA